MASAPVAEPAEAAGTTARLRHRGRVPAPPLSAPPRDPHAPPRDPGALLRNAHALMLNTALTGLFGLGYWLAAARHYHAADVGQASAAFAAMNLLAGFTALSLTGALARFLPRSGDRAAALVGRAYLASTAVSAFAALLFVLGARHFGASYGELRSWPAGLAFVGSVLCWVIFTLQDGVLIGLRSAIWLPVENGLFGVAKLILLVALAAALPRGGIYLSWMLPVVVALPLVNMLIFGGILPRQAAGAADAVGPTGRQVARFLAGDSAGSLCMLASGNLVPVLVALIVSPALTAYFYIAWAIGGTLDLLGINMAASLTVEGALDAGSLAANCAAALRRMMIILAPAAAGLALLAPWLLGLFGPGYAEHGAPVLVLLAAATLLRAVNELYLGALRAQSRTHLVAMIQVLRACLVLGGVLGLTAAMGTVGAALGVLAGQAATAALAGPGLCRVCRGAGQRQLPAQAGPR